MTILGETVANLGIVYINLGQYQQAIDSLQQTLSIARQIGDRQSEANSLNNLVGYALYRSGQANAAQQTLRDSIKAFETLRQRLNDIQQVSILDTQQSPYINLQRHRDERAIERHNAGNARVIPIILRPCDWKGFPFSKLQILPKDGKPVTQWSDRDSAFLNVVEGIRRAVDTLQTPKG